MEKKHTPIKGWVRVLIFIIPFFIVAGIFQVVGMKILGLNMTHQPESVEPFQALVLELCMLIGTLIVVGLLRRYIDKESFMSTGFYRFRSIKDGSIGFAIGAVIMILGFTCLIGLKEITWVGTQFDSLKIFQLIVFYIF